MFNMRELIPWNRSREVGTGRRIEHPLMTFQREVDRLFDEMWRGFDLPTTWRTDRSLLTPRIDVRETDDAVIVSAELPGLEEKDVEVTLSDDVLTIRGEKKSEREEKDGGYSYSERSFGTFERRIPIDASVMEDKVAATFKNGVLTVSLPKSPEAQKQVKRIPIGGGGEATSEQKAA